MHGTCIKITLMYVHKFNGDDGGKMFRSCNKRSVF